MELNTIKKTLQGSQSKTQNEQNEDIKEATDHLNKLLQEYKREPSTLAEKVTAIERTLEQHTRELSDLKMKMSEVVPTLSQSSLKVFNRAIDKDEVTCSITENASESYTIEEKLTDLGSKLEAFADSLIPKERRLSFNRKTRWSASFTDDVTTESPTLQRSTSVSSAGSSGHGTLKSQNSKSNLFAIAEDNDFSTLQRSFSVSSTNDADISEDATCMPVQTNSTPFKKNRHEDNIVDVLWAMSSLVDVMKKLNIDENST